MNPSALAVQLAKAICQGSPPVVGLPLSVEDLEYIRQEVERFMQAGGSVPTAEEIQGRIVRFEALYGPSEFK